jgi:hypothetical protein
MNSARVNRAAPVQLKQPMIAIITYVSRGSTPAATISRKSTGTAMKISTMRKRTMSTFPPK